MALEDGGPAFPQTMVIGPDGQLTCGWGYGVGGISARDYFAAAALAECPDAITEDDAPKVAKLAYAIADAMLAERKK